MKLGTKIMALVFILSFYFTIPTINNIDMAAVRTCELEST
jgi:hypothetical protein